MVIGEERAAGEEVLFNYGGERSSMELLLTYGFIEADNTADCIVLVLESPLSA